MGMIVVGDGGRSGRAEMRGLLIFLNCLAGLAIVLDPFVSSDAFSFWYVLVLGIIVIAVRWHYIRRVSAEWDGLDSAGRWKLGLAGVFVPGLIGAFFVIGLVILFVGFLMNGLGEAFSGKPQPGMGGWAGAAPSSGVRGRGTGGHGRSYGPPAWGSWWGDDRVYYGNDGVLLGIGEDRATIGGDGRLISLGDKKVEYDSLGRVNLIGDERVQYSGRGATPLQVGERRVI